MSRYSWILFDVLAVLSGYLMNFKHADMDQLSAIRAALVYDRLARHYADWVRSCQRSPQLEKVFVGWATQLTAQCVLKGENSSAAAATPRPPLYTWNYLVRPQHVL